MCTLLTKLFKDKGGGGGCGSGFGREMVGKGGDGVLHNQSNDSFELKLK